MADQKLTPEIESVLRAARIEGNKLHLVGQLSPKEYKAVKEFLLLVGAVWDKKQKCHVFSGDPAKLMFAMEEGEAKDIKKKRQAFYTPLDLVEEVVRIADVKGKDILEPSCGDGRFIRECFKQGAVGIDVVEICEEEAEKVATEFFGRIAIHVGDFLEFNPITDDNFLPEYDILIGNPPYSRTDWLKHTLHAFKFVKPGGKLVFILPNSIHSNKKFQDFVLDKKWEYREIPAGAFKSEGTNIATNIVTIYK